MFIIKTINGVEMSLVSKRDSRRKNLRFASDANTLASIKVVREDGVLGFSSIVINESRNGCNVVLPIVDLHKGEIIQIQLGNFNSIEALVRWTKVVDNDIMRVGIEYKF